MLGDEASACNARRVKNVYLRSTIDVERCVWTASLQGEGSSDNRRLLFVISLLIVK